MWALLSDPGHATGFEHLGEAHAPLRRLVEQLAGREYAGRVYAFQWMTSFNLTTAPTDQEIAKHDVIGIDYRPDQGIFRVGYNERTGPGRSPQFRVCQSHEVGEVVDRSVRRLLLSPPPPRSEPAGAQGVLALVLFASMFVYLVCWSLLWAGIQLTTLMLLSLGLMGTTTSMLLIGMSVNRSWTVGRWTSRSGAPAAPPGRLTSLGIGLVFGGGGLFFLSTAVVGYDEPPRLAVLPFLGVSAVGFVLCLVGAKVGCEGDSARAIQAALRNYAERHDGWFPRGEASPEASLSLLHWENNSERVTAAVLRGRSVPEAAVRARLEGGQLLTPETCGWHYVEGLRTSDDPRLALFWDKAGSGRTDAPRSGGGHLVYFVAGGIEFIPGYRWEAFLAEQEWLRAGVLR